MKITISEEVKKLCPQVCLGLLRYQADVQPAGLALNAEFAQAVQTAARNLKIEEVASQAHVKSTRAAYRALGFDPTARRNSAESLLRRAVRGLEFYSVSNVVDTGNLFSLLTGYSDGSYDVTQLQGNVELRRAPAGTHYVGIGKSEMNIASLPVLFDDLGPFGNPSSDSRRAMIQPGPREILTVVYAFDGKDALAPCLDQFAALLTTFCAAKSITKENAGEKTKPNA